MGDVVAELRARVNAPARCLAGPVLIASAHASSALPTVRTTLGNIVLIHSTFTRCSSPERKGCDRELMVYHGIEKSRLRRTALQQQQHFHVSSGITEDPVI